VTEYLGIDVGGSGVKGAMVDVVDGRLLSKRVRIPTPQPATPSAIAETVAAVAAQAEWSGDRLGCALPAVVTQGVVRTASNIDSGWIGTDAAALISSAVGGSATILNDADAAGIAEVRLGAARGFRGQVLLLTFGTGIGSALLADGVLVTNTELGHLERNGVEVEHIASAKVQEDEDLSLGEWASRVNSVVASYERVLWPDLIIIGGGISKQFDEYAEVLTARARIVPAVFRNNAGLVGAALAAEEAA
jgi:polyphosphate glucokinase